MVNRPAPLIIEKLTYEAPFDFETLLAYFKSHQIQGVETIDETSYSRVYRAEGTLAKVTISHPQAKKNQTDAVHIEIDSKTPLTQAAVDELKMRVSRMFDLALDPKVIQKSFSRSAHLKALYKKYPGIRIPTSWDPFEAMITTVLGQLVSMEQAGRLVLQLVEAVGEKVKDPATGETTHLFPTPEAMVAASLEEVRTTGARRRTLHHLAGVVASGELSLALDQDPEAFKAKLLLQPGIGPWSAEYVTLRALGNQDSFPGTDLILKRAVEAFPDLILNDVKPYRSYAALYLWKEHAKTFSKKGGNKGGKKMPKGKS